MDLAELLALIGKNMEALQPNSMALFMLPVRFGVGMCGYIHTWDAELSGSSISWLMKIECTAVTTPRTRLRSHLPVTCSKRRSHKALPTTLSYSSLGESTISVFTIPGASWGSLHMGFPWDHFLEQVGTCVQWQEGGAIGWPTLLYKTMGQGGR